MTMGVLQPNVTCIIAAMPPDSPTIEPTARSKFPETISSTTPIAITPVIDMVLIRFERLRDLKKIPSVMIWKKIAIRISANIIV